PQPEDHSAGLEEADFVVGLLGPAPAERFVEGARPGEVGDAERHQADPLVHCHGPSSISRPIPTLMPVILRPVAARCLERNGHNTGQPARTASYGLYVPCLVVGHEAPASTTASTLCPVMVGRGRELAQLQRAWRAGGHMLVVRGRAGIGKSRLIREFADWV